MGERWGLKFWLAVRDELGKLPLEPGPAGGRGGQQLSLTSAGAGKLQENEDASPNPVHPLCPPRPAAGGQPQLLRVPHLRPGGRAPAGALGRHGSGQQEPREDPRDPLQHTPASLGEPHGTQAVPGVPSPSRDFPPGVGGSSPHGGVAAAPPLLLVESKAWEVFGLPQSPGGAEGDRGRAVGAGYPLPSRSHHSVHRPRALAPRQGRAGTDGHGAIPVPAPRGFPPPYCCSHPPFFLPRGSSSPSTSPSTATSCGR